VTSPSRVFYLPDFGAGKTTALCAKGQGKVFSGKLFSGKVFSGKYLHVVDIHNNKLLRGTTAREIFTCGGYS
jgi:hypothetical protein